MVIALPKEEDDSSDDEDESMESDDDEDNAASGPAEILTNLCIFGTTLLALSHDGRKMYVWDIPTYVKPASNPGAGPTHAVTPYATIEFAPDFTATKLVHPATYLNKVVVASREGALAVFNIRTASVLVVAYDRARLTKFGCRSLIHTFEPTELLATPSRITAIAQSPAIDVLGVGFASGQCVLFDVRLGEILGRVRLEGEGAGEVTGVAFRNGTFRLAASERNADEIDRRYFANSRSFFVDWTYCPLRSGRQAQAVASCACRSRGSDWRTGVVARATAHDDFGWR